ncbi:hypothetical protein OHD60_15550 [Escherichia coli]|nr:hypothetical protein [Escherichia coli]
MTKNVKVVGEPPEEPSPLVIFISLVPTLLLIEVWIFFMRQMVAMVAACHVVW